MLILPIKKQWFDMIVKGEKKEEYREIKPYYDSRFKEYIPRFPLPTDIEYECVHCKKHPIFYVIFRNGYSRNSPQIKCKCKLTIGQGKEEWGAEPNKENYILEILEVLEVKECI